MPDYSGGLWGFSAVPEPRLARPPGAGFGELAGAALGAYGAAQNRDLQLRRLAMEDSLRRAQMANTQEYRTARLNESKANTDLARQRMTDAEQAGVERRQAAMDEATRKPYEQAVSQYGPEGAAAAGPELAGMRTIAGQIPKLSTTKSMVFPAYNVGQGTFEPGDVKSGESPRDEALRNFNELSASASQKVQDWRQGLTAERARTAGNAASAADTRQQRAFAQQEHQSALGELSGAVRQKSIDSAIYGAMTPEQQADYDRKWQAGVNMSLARERQARQRLQNLGVPMEEPDLGGYYDLGGKRPEAAPGGGPPVPPGLEKRTPQETGPAVGPGANVGLGVAPLQGTGPVAPFTRPPSTGSLPPEAPLERRGAPTGAPKAVPPAPADVQSAAAIIANLQKKYPGVPIDEIKRRARAGER